MRTPHPVVYRGGGAPDYEDETVEYLYMLRYAFAYAYEYYTMYKAWKNMLGAKTKVAVTSVGCGAYLDYWALTRVYGSYNIDNIDYTGIDPVDWKYARELLFGGDEQPDFFKGLLEDYLNSDKFKSADAYVFPKSLGEIRNKDRELEIFDLLCDRLKQNNRESVWFLLSMPFNGTSDGVRENEETAEKLIESLKKNGYSLKNDEKNPPPQDKAIWTLDVKLFKWFWQKDKDGKNDVDKAIEVCANIENTCAKSEGCDACTNNYKKCPGGNWSPALKDSYMWWRILEFRRGGAGK